MTPWFDGTGGGEVEDAGWVVSRMVASTVQPLWWDGGFIRERRQGVVEMGMTPTGTGRCACERVWVIMIEPLLSVSLRSERREPRGLVGISSSRALAPFLSPDGKEPVAAVS